MQGVIAGFGFSPEGFDQTPRDLAGHRSTSSEYVEQGGTQVGWLCSFQEIAIRSSFKSKKYQFLVIHGCENDDLDFWQSAFRRAVHSIPDIRGKKISINMTSGCCCGIVRKASSPLVHEHTQSKSGKDLSN
jgi:hypothetical protein